ncbi:mycofactocin precursor MftA [Streptomyces sp. NPDC005336]
MSEEVRTAQQDADVTTDTTAIPAEIVEELLVEEVSIDGMCGVY